MACPFDGIAEHGNGGPEDDDLPFFPVVPPVPLFAPAKKGEEATPKIETMIEELLDDPIIKEAFDAIQGPGRSFNVPEVPKPGERIEIRGGVPRVAKKRKVAFNFGGNSTEDFEVEPIQEVILKVVERAVKEVPTDPPPKEVVTRAQEEALVDKPTRRGFHKPPFRGATFPMQIAEEAAARIFESVNDRGFDPTPKQKPPSTAQRLKAAQARPAELRGEAARQRPPAGITRAPRTGGGGGFTMRSIVNDIVKGRFTR